MGKIFFEFLFLCLCFLLAEAESIFLIGWFLPLFLFLFWRFFGEERLYEVAFLAGFCRDLFWGRDLGKTAFLFLVFAFFLEFLGGAVLKERKSLR